MATFDKPKPSPAVPRDLLPVIRDSGVLSEKQFAEVKAMVLSGAYPSSSVALADRLVKEKVLTGYQTRRFLNNKSNGFLVGRYVIQDRIGAGSMGRVYKAHHQMMDRLVAIKIIAPEIVANEKVVARFQREMKLVGRLDHPNVIRAFDADQINRLLYIVMEYVPGESLSQLLRKGTFRPMEMAGFAAQAALGLAHAHSQGIVHRDIKPSNLLLTEDRQIKVLDLGLGVLMEADSTTSFATADGITVGTVDYMSPEQACGREVDGRSDLFSLGCSMYHLITGLLPFPGDSPIERMGKRISGRPVPITDVMPEVPGALVRVLDRLLAHKPQDRYQTAGEAAEALLSLVRPKARTPSPTPPSVRRTRRIEPPPPAALPLDPVAKAVGTGLRARGNAPPAALPLDPVAKVVPEYPEWFQPLARLTETRPELALLGLMVSAAALFTAGFVVALLLR